LEIARSAEDKYLFWPSVTAIGTLFITGYLLASVSLWAFAAAYVGLVTSVLASLVIVIYLFLKRWRSALSLPILPVVTSAAIAYPRPVIAPFIVLGEDLHLLVNLPSYEARIALLKESQGSRHHVFDLGGTISLGVVLIYDETDKMDLPPEQRHWDDKEFESLVRRCGARVHRVRGHYYRCEI
jgi:hypothetical protein